MVQQGLEHFVYQDFRKTPGISSIWEWIKKESEWLTSAKLGYKFVNFVVHVFYVFELLLLDTSKGTWNYSVTPETMVNEWV